MLSKKIGAIFVWLLVAMMSPALAAAPAKQAQLIDRIIVVVNDDVITQHELDVRLAVAVSQLKKQGTLLPDTKVLKKQLLERMIGNLLQKQFAKETGLRIDEEQLDKALTRIAQKNKFSSLANFRRKLEKEGIDFKKFREEIRTEILTVRIRQREVDSKLIISENEIQNYLKTQAELPNKGEEFQLAHIMVVVPEQASAEKIQHYKSKAEQALKKLRGGAPFAQVAAGYSDASDALKGGDLGWRSADRIPSIFAEAIQKMKPGEVSEILRGPNGFHIIKLISKRSKDAPIVITQTHARHILIKTSELVPESEAKNRLLAIKRRIDKGADFAAQAKLYSEDGSAPQGGDLGWLSPGATVAKFEKAMDALKINQVSGLVQTGFGWHLIQVLARRNTDVSDEQKKQKAREAIHAFRSDAAFQDWQRQLRDRAFIEYHTER